MSRERVVLSYEQFMHLWQILNKQGHELPVDRGVAKTGYISFVWQGIAWTTKGDDE